MFSRRQESDGFNIPPRPQILKDLKKQLEKEDCTLDSISAIVMRDVGICSKVVKTVNSPAFGLSKKIDSLPEAIQLLGKSATIDITHSFFTEANADDPFLETLWESSEKAALTSYFLCHSFDIEEADLCYMLALFHNCGKAILYQKSANYAEIIANAYNLSLIHI